MERACALKSQVSTRHVVSKFIVTSAKYVENTQLVIGQVPEQNFSFVRRPEADLKKNPLH